MSKHNNEHKTRFGVMMTPEADPFSRAKRFIARINAMSEEEYEEAQLEVTLEWLDLSAHLNDEQYHIINDMWRTET